MKVLLPTSVLLFSLCALFLAGCKQAWHIFRSLSGEPHIPLAILQVMQKTWHCEADGVSTVQHFYHSQEEENTTPRKSLRVSNTVPDELIKLINRNSQWQISPSFKANLYFRWGRQSRKPTFLFTMINESEWNNELQILQCIHYSILLFTVFSKWNILKRQHIQLKRLKKKNLYRFTKICSCTRVMFFVYFCLSI